MKMQNILKKLLLTGIISRKSTVLFCISMVSMFIYGQGSYNTSMPVIIPASPEAAAIAKYLNYPMDHGTGVPKIEIPLFEIKSGSLVLPITLNYHASGIKVNQPDGWVGLGWTLNAEPSVTRSIKGLADDENGGLLSNSNFGKTNDLNYLIQFANGWFDEEPDEFYYRLLDKSGGFYYSKNPQNQSWKIVTLPYTPVEINHRIKTTSVFKFFDRLTITDETGATYYFGTSQDNIREAIEYNYIMTWSEEPITTWKCTEVISADKADTITFIYSDINETYYKLTDFLHVEEDLSTNSAFMPCYTASPHVCTFSMNSSPATNSYYVDSNGNGHNTSCDCDFSYPMDHTTTVKSKKLQEIRFGNGRVVFTTGSNNKLQKIEVFNRSGQNVKTINFSGNLYGQSSYYDRGKRYALNELTVQQPGQTEREKYSFQYNSIANIPDYTTSRAMDYWGYYNGQDTNKILIPRQQIETRLSTGTVLKYWIGGANRNPNAEKMKYGILELITYPTGGNTYFEYEPHLTPEGMVGGLRVANIRDYDPITGKIHYKVYQYGKNSNGQGTLRLKADMMDYTYEQIKWYTSGYSKLRVFNAQSLFDPFFSDGAHVVYDQVIEYQSSTSNYIGSSGWTKYAYQHRYAPLTRVGTTSIVYNSRTDWTSGVMTDKSVITQNKDTVTTTRYQYMSNYKPESILARKIFRNRLLYSSNSSMYDEDFTIESYYISSGANKLISETTVDKCPNGEVATTKTYTYEPNKLFTSQVTSSSSNGNNLINTYKYPETVNGLTGDAETARQALIANKQFNTLLEESQTEGSANITTYNRYKLFNSQARLSQVDANTGPGRSVETRILYNNYDKQGNPLYITKDNADQVVYLWGYNYQYPIAEIKGASYTEVTNKISASTLNTIAAKNEPATADWTSINNLRTQLPNAMVTTYTYKPLVGILTVTDPGGKKTSYDYDVFGRLQTIKDHNNKIIEQYNYHYKN